MKGFSRSCNSYFMGLLLCFVVTGCQDLLEVKTVTSLSQGESPQENQINNDDERVTLPSAEISFCSDLDLGAINWPSDMPQLEQNLYALALNITGSFEGFSEFTNIANNFDGQGVSLGIFQQNLGQGTLQPLLLQAHQSDSSLLSQYFNNSQKQQILEMLTLWSGVGVRQKLSLFAPFMAEISFEEMQGNHLDKVSLRLPSTEAFVLQKALNPVNAQSVDWAVKNLYQDSQGITFHAPWKNNLQAFAGDPRYMSLQVQAGRYLHEKAISFMQSYNAKELRSYLFFFDIAVQNGGIQTSVRQKYLEAIANQPELTENERMKILLQYRLERVIDRYKDDVKSRKLTLLTGQGVVHRSDRNLPEEYCVSPWDQIIL